MLECYAAPRCYVQRRQSAGFCTTYWRPTPRCTLARRLSRMSDSVLSLHFTRYGTYNRGVSGFYTILWVRISQKIITCKKNRDIILFGCVFFMKKRLRSKRIVTQDHRFILVMTTGQEWSDVLYADVFIKS